MEYKDWFPDGSMPDRRDPKARRLVIEADRSRVVTIEKILNHPHRAGIEHTVWLLNILYEASPEATLLAIKFFAEAKNEK